MELSDSDAGGLGEGELPDDFEAERLLARVRERLVGVSSKPVEIGRYQLRDKVGAGAAGVVYEAHDPELDRRIAIKLLEAEDEVLAARFLREARALADLSHANVVQVYDAGKAGRRVWIAMELVEGATLGGWLEAESRDPRDIVRMFAEAGRGLAAAHDRGIVHRDFKPANVLVGADGRPRVSDFGLAREVSRGEDAGVTMSDGVVPTAGAESLTRTGAVLGTPAYMAPEQATGEAIDARADQFSFCVALFEALVGHRPFRGTTLTALIEATRAGVPASEQRQLPPRLRRTIVRGLSASAEDRHPDMASLLRTLVPTRNTLARWVLLGAGATIATGAALTGLSGQDTEACEAAGVQLAARWADEDRPALEQAFTDSELPSASSTWARVAPRLDEAIDGWVAARREVCALPPTAAHLDGARWCLQGRARHIEAVTQRLRQGGLAGIRSAAQAVGELEPAASCLDPEVVAKTEAPPPTELRGAVDEILQRLAFARAATNAGDDDAALREYDGAVEAAEALEYAPVLAEALADQGRARTKASPDEGIATLQRAHALAIEHGRHDTALRAAVGLVWALGMVRQQPDDAETWLRHARSSLERRGNRAEEQALILNAAASLASVRGNFAEAVTLFEKLVAARAVLDSGSLRLATAQRNLGRALLYAGRTEDARAELEDALEVAVTAVGDDHPLVGAIHQALGGVAWGQQRLDDAFEGFSRAAAIHEAAEDWSALANDVGGLASVAQARQRNDEAIAHHLRSIELQERAHGSDHPNVARQLDNYSTALQAAGRFAEAEPPLRRSLEIKRAALGPGHRDLGLTHIHLGTLAGFQGDPGRGEREFQTAVDILRAAAGPEHSLTAEALGGLAHARVAQQHYDDAIEPAQTALSIYAKVGAFPSQIADVQTTLAGALVATADAPCKGSDDAQCVRARSLAASAREAYVALGPTMQPQVDALDAWVTPNL